MRERYLFLISVYLFFISCSERNDYKTYLESYEPMVEAAGVLTDVLVHDIFSPPVSSRIYSYTSIAAFEVVALGAPDEYVSLTGQLNGFEPKEFHPDEDCYFPLAALAAYYKVAARFVFSETGITNKREELLQKAKKMGMPQKTLDVSIALGEEVADHVIAYASKDNYHQSRSFEKYTVRNDNNSWKPTPPAYMDGIEPHWNKIRPLGLDSADQFKPLPATIFSDIPESQFYEEAKAVMDIGNNLTDEQREIAFFWDCNPYKMNVKGHVMYAEKKISPGGHWIGIASIASKTANVDWKATTEAITLTAIHVFDGFISCWDEKYRSVLIRPETYINRYMDEDWVPLLQTPPFPEYTSGHSVVSGSASRALTRLFGEPFHFVDTTEVKFGLGIREFNSFNEAADEAAISRFYGGIHYVPAIDNGLDQGVMVANHLSSRINTRRND